MIDKLSWYLSQISNNEIGTKEDADDVLDFLEGWGMAPPFINHDDSSWEPENE